MSGRGGKKNGLNGKQGSQPRVSMTLREESSGKKQGSVNAKTMCKLDHLKNIAAWAATKASIPSLAAFFGEHLAATNEALGLCADPSSFVCERCESILEPGNNCTVRIEKSKSKTCHRRKKSNLTTQNHVVYSCHFCSHRNLMRGTAKGYIKEICPPKAKPPLKSISSIEKCRSLSEAPRSIPVDADSLPPTIDGHNNLETSSPATQLPVNRLSLLDSKKKRKRSGAKKVAEPEISSTAENSITASSKRRKKSWTSLKEIAQTQSSSKHDNGKKFSDLTICTYYHVTNPY